MFQLRARHVAVLVVPCSKTFTTFLQHSYTAAWLSSTIQVHMP
jgi:hypothetical protein